MRELWDILSNKDLRLIYMVLIESIVLYGTIGWGGYYDNVLSQLLTSQNTSIKISLKKDRKYNTK